MSLVLGLEPVESALLGLTSLVAVVYFFNARTNVILGLVHMILFAEYIVLIFD